jgi:aspartyl-tRNA(Asn)/glutamyl-tRNA(Gln) amidotransferase subunit A
MTKLHDMAAVDLLAAYKTQTLSPVDVVNAAIQRIEAWEPKLRALYAPDFGGARSAA